MKIFAIGDIVGERAVAYLREKLWEYRRRERIDLVIANGENASETNGITAKTAQELLAAGVDVITLGNHAFGKRDLYPLLEREERIIRPANFPPEAPGMGYTLADAAGWRVLCINACGRTFMDNYADPFTTVERILEREAGRYDYSVLDLHAEATSEKLAMARVFDGRLHVIFGTHTHVTTADEQILPHGTAYQTDLGMTGPVDGIIGTETECVIAKFRTLMPTHFRVAGGEIRTHGTLFELQDDKAVSAQRVTW